MDHAFGTKCKILCLTYNVKILLFFLVFFQKFYIIYDLVQVLYSVLFSGSYFCLPYLPAPSLLCCSIVVHLSKSVDDMGRRLFLILHSINVCVYPSISISFDYCSFANGQNDFSHFFLFKIVLAVSVPLPCHIFRILHNFRIIYSYRKILLGFPKVANKQLNQTQAFCGLRPLRKPVVFLQ